MSAHLRGPESDAPADPAADADAVSGAAPAAETAEGADAAKGAPTEAEAIAALTEHGATGRDELAQALGVLGRVLSRFDAVPSLRIGSVAVFHDEVRVEEGDFTIGGAEHGAGRSRLGAPPLPREVLKRHISAFVEPPGYGRARRILEREHLVVLAGPARSGREACALALLAELADSARLHLLGPDPRAAEDRWRTGAKGGGYVASEVDPDDLAALDETWLRGAAKALRDTGGYLVLVTGAAAAVPGHPVAGVEFLAADLGLPDPLEVLRRRARGAVRVERHARLDAVLADAGIARLLEEERAPRYAARVATVLAEAANSGGDLARTVAALCDPTDRVRVWFERTDAAQPESDQELSLAIAAAVLDGCGYLAVTDAATALYRRWHEGETRIRYRRLLRTTQRWLRACEPAGSASVHGDPMPETLGYRDARVQPIVLAYVWTELDGLRPALVPWLRELARNADVDVRACAAASAGLLATLDFSYALHNLVLPWASSRIPAVRTCAALALAVPSRDPRYADRVWAVLEDWAGRRPSPVGNALAGTAAEAVGGVAADGAPTRALEILHDAAGRADWDCLTAVAVGLLDLIETGHAAHCLEALLDWSEEQDESPPVIRALAMFIAVARTPSALAPARAEGSAAPAAEPSSRPDGGHGAHGGHGHGGHGEAGARPRSRVTATGIDGAKRVLAAHDAAPAGRPAVSSRISRPRTAPAAAAPGAVAAAPGRAGRTGRDAEPLPALLGAADRHRAALRDLWGRALACKPLRPAALAALRSWVDLAEHDEATLNRVAGLCLQVRGLGGKHAARLDYHLEMWAGGGHGTERSAAAARIRTLIDPAHR